jgi:hypothetical protein
MNNLYGSLPFRPLLSSLERVEHNRAFVLDSKCLALEFLLSYPGPDLAKSFFNLSAIDGSSDGSDGPS